MSSTTARMTCLMACSVLASCAVPQDRAVTLTPMSKGRHEITLREKRFGLGGPCSFPFNPAFYTESDYFVIGKAAGRIPASQVALFHAATLQPLDRQKALEGEIEFSPDGRTLDIRLQEPRYDDGYTISRHVPYSRNGHYQVNTAN